jgi:hypothetical protein
MVLNLKSKASLSLPYLDTLLISWRIGWDMSVFPTSISTVGTISTGIVHYYELPIIVLSRMVMAMTSECQVYG